MSNNPVLDIAFPKAKIDHNAFVIVKTLQKEGFETYLVGGCVRDLLLDRSPKDFDIATTATPSQISRIFKNCRLIGRRFRLAHIYYGPEIYEVATFRGQGAEGFSNPSEGDDAFIERTNTFGTPQQDALSRDFTMNGLFYDPIEGKVLDHVNGYPDVESKIVRSIGDPLIRFVEDPVRILRAVKFSARLGFELEERVVKAIGEHSNKIMECATARVTEEIFRLGESRCAKESFLIMEKCGVMEAVLPTLSAHLGGENGEVNRQVFYRTLLWLDRLGKAHGTLPRDFVLTVLYLWPALANLDEENPGDWGKETEAWYHEHGVRLQVPVRLRSRFYLLMAMLQRMIDPQSARRFRRARALVRQPAFPQALALLRVVFLTTGEHRERYDWWRDRAEEERISAAPICLPKPRPNKPGSDPKGGERDSRRKSRRSRGGRRR